MQAILTMLLLAAAAVSSVHAHVTANPNVGVPGAYFSTVFRVPHGCGLNGTTGLTVTIADGCTSVKPRPVPGWTITIGRRPLSPPIVAEGQTINTTIDSIAWTALAGPLSVDYYEEFGLTMKLPSANDSTVLYFPTVQACAGGVFNNWTIIPVAGQPAPATPAPSVTLNKNGTLALGPASTSGAGPSRARRGVVVGAAALTVVSLVLLLA
ncbi:hypothetical protein SeLEV6574_g00892 [Synchytrium endobioticum]|uniref:YncI copper-binding domain-containing protein n=1 Tax=Synchytrium endobioticum TaxID=286115 RepID=A0A507DFX9_9FUNG|nr:hypothetical protein SeLEV6574_g00892 [Synchytrium endobioticum]